MHEALKLEEINFDENGLIPAVIQDAGSGEVLMLAYMNKESLAKTIETGRTWFYSRSRQRLWNKGETSGNFQEVTEIKYDCDGDALLVKVIQHGPACHKGERSCFHNALTKSEEESCMGIVLHELYRVIEDRRRVMPQGSYTTYLFKEGLDKILKKVGEETAETIIASKNGSINELTYETADLLYHLLVLSVYHGLTLEKIAAELSRRRK